MKDEIKVKKGKASKAQGGLFELRVRLDLEEKGWICDKWTNQVEFEKDTKKIVDMAKKDFPKMAKGINFGKLVKAKNKWSGPGRPMMMGAGFPDFIAFRLKDNKLFPELKDYEVIGVESKMTGELDRLEKEKCKWLLDNNIFSKILIASKHKIKNRVHIEYEDFKEKYWRFYEKSKD